MARVVAVMILLAISALSVQAATVPSAASAGTTTVSPPLVVNTWNADGWPNGVSGWSLNLNYRPIGTFMWVRTAPVGANMNIDSIYYAVDYDTQSSDRPFWLRLCNRGTFNTTTGACAGLSSGQLSNTPSGGRVVSNGGLACIGNVCDAFELEVNAAYGSGHVYGMNISATLRDDVTPAQNASVGANALTSGKWLRGSVTGGVATTDTGGVGIGAMRLNVDNVERAAHYPTCNTSLWIPCPGSANWAPTLDTTKFTDGPHNTLITSTDAALNTASTGLFTIKVDNTKPAAPVAIEAIGNGLSGWSSTNSFDLSWENGAEVDENATQSGLERVIVDVNPTDPDAQSDPAAVTVPIGGSVGAISATRTGVTGISVPAVGEWTIRLRLVDKAGNLSDVGDGSDGGVDSDATAGWDPSAPAKADGRANGWISRAELAGGLAKQGWQLPKTAAGEAPVCGWGLSVSDDPSEAGGTAITVGTPTNEWTIPSNLIEGRHWSHIRAISCAKVPADVTDHQEVNVDLTDPTAAFSGVTDDSWHKDGQQVTMRGSDALSGMVGANPALDDSTEGAYISYKLDGSGPADSDAPRSDTATISVTGEGAKQLRFAPVDVAGNKATTTVVNFGIDASNPEGYFEAQDANRPTLIRAPLFDNVSGVENGVLQYRPESGGDWAALPTSLASFSGDLVNGVAKSAVAQARFPDIKVPRGTYQLRVIAQDQAGNELVTSEDKNGNPYRVTNPMRKGTGLSAFVYRGLHKCKRKKKNKCVKKKKGKVYLVGGKASTSVGYKRAGIVQGYLTTSSYGALAKQPLEIYTTVQGQEEKLEGSASTKRDGSYYFRLKPGVSRKVRVVFGGTELLQDSQSKVSFGTAAKLRIKPSRRHVYSGQKVTFSGRVIAVDKRYPQAGKIIALQYLTGGKWRPAIAITRTDKKGYFKVSYRFGRVTRGVRSRIKFRVMAPAEIGWSHVTSASRTRIVKVN